MDGHNGTDVNREGEGDANDAKGAPEKSEESILVKKLVGPEQRSLWLGQSDHQLTFSEFSFAGRCFVLPCTPSNCSRAVAAAKSVGVP